MSKGIRLQTAEMSIPTGTTAGTALELRVVMDANYSRCTGYAVFEKSNANNHKYEIGIADRDGKIQDIVIADFLLTNEAVKPEDRMRKADFPAAQNQITVVVRPLVNVAANIDLYVVFQLEK